MDSHEQTGISIKLFIFNAMLVFLIVLMIFVIYGSKHMVATEVKDNQAVASLDAFEKIDLEAKSVYVYDIQTNKVLYKKNEFIQLPLASITKLMSALVASELIPRNSKITIKKEFLATEGDSGLLVDEAWEMRDLLDFSLMVSSNDGMRSVASVAGAFDLQTDDYNLGRKDFIEKMNKKAKELDLKQTYFTNESGLDVGGLSGGYGSAIDVANLMKYILKTNPEMVEATKYESLNIASFDKNHKADNTNTSIEEIPGLIASKTGFTDMAGGNLVVAFDASIGHPIIVVVLGSSVDGRFKDVSKLVEASLRSIAE